MTTETSHLTVNALLKQLQALKKQGYGEAKIVIPTDHEGNDYRHLYYNAQPMSKELLEAIEYTNSHLAEEIAPEIEKHILLG